MGRFAALLFVTTACGSVAAETENRPETSAPSLHIRHEKSAWLTDMSKRLEDRVSDREVRMVLLNGVLAESKRANLDPQLVLSLIDVASGFKKYAVSSGGARGYMQVAPYWTKSAISTDANLFHVLVNLRYGCTLLREFLDRENGNVRKALVRYRNQMDGQFNDKSLPAERQSDFPDIVVRLHNTRWRYDTASM